MNKNQLERIQLHVTLDGYGWQGGKIFTEVDEYITKQDVMWGWNIFKIGAELRHNGNFDGLCDIVSIRMELIYYHPVKYHSSGLINYRVVSTEFSESTINRINDLDL